MWLQNQQKNKNACASKIWFDIRPYLGHQPTLRLRDLSTFCYWINPRFNKAMLFPLKQLLWECLSNRDRVSANIKDLLVSWKVCNETFVELHQSDRSIRPVSHHYPISWRCAGSDASFVLQQEKSQGIQQYPINKPTPTQVNGSLPSLLHQQILFSGCPSSNRFFLVKSTKHIWDRMHAFIFPTACIHLCIALICFSFSSWVFCRIQSETKSGVLHSVVLS